MTEPYTPTTEEVRMAYVGEPEHWLDDKITAEFDRWFQAEIEKAERRGEVLATGRRIASENSELMRRLGDK